MNNSLKLLLEQVYELEGLLLVADNHGSETNEYVFDLIHKKAGSIAELSKWVNADAFADDKPVESAKPDEAEVEKPAETVEPAPAEKEITASIDEYKDVLKRQNSLVLLNKAIQAGQISMIEYFVDVTTYYQSVQNYLQLQNQYQKVMAQLYKYRL